MTVDPGRPTAGAGRETGDGTADVEATAAELSRERRRAPGIQLDCHANPDVPHIGMVFVHGIGSQAPGETLLDWGSAIIGALLDARLNRRTSADPVIDSQLDPGPGQSRFIELQLPATTADGKTIPEQHWVMTEAWWAQRVRPPSFGQMAEWLGPNGAIRRIVLALLPRAGEIHDPRLRPHAETHSLHRAAPGIERVEEDVAPGPPAGMKEKPREGISAILRYPAGFYFQAISALILLLYGILRSIEKLIPIGPFKDGALTRPIDSFVLDWFGDVYVLLNNQAEGASIRGQLLDSLNDLQAIGCKDITVIAHSGGAIVSYMTLVDASSAGQRVDRLVTHGEAANLAWRLTAGEDGQNRGEAELRFERLYRTLPNAPHRRDMAWHDFWASKDPAPVGVLQIPREQNLDDEDDRKALGRVHSHAVWNRLSLGNDHGSYWDNDEEFLVPLLRILENRGEAGLFGPTAGDEVRSNKRRRRLTVLSLLTQLALFAPLAAVIATFVLGSKTLERAGNAAADLWARIPGSNLISEPLNSIRDAHLETTPVGSFIAEAGVWVIVVVLFLATIYSVIAPPERPIPWAEATGWRRAVWWFFTLAPFLALLMIGVALGAAANLFIGGSTARAIDVGRATGVALLVLLAWLGAWAVISRRYRQGKGGGSDTTSTPDVSPAPETGGHKAMRIVVDALDYVNTVLSLVLAVVLVISPFVAMAVFADTGRIVLGIAVVLIAFQILGRIGQWRWTVWDERERTAARTGEPPPSDGQASQTTPSATGDAPPGNGRVVAQIVLLSITLLALFVGVIFNLDPVLLAAAGLTALTVLLGVAVDVVDAQRNERRQLARSILKKSMMRSR